MGKATQDLRNEHEAILHVFTILDHVLESKSIGDPALLRFGNELISFLKIFADKCHHGKEEGFLFAELEKHGVPNRGGPIGVMLAEHVRGRENITSMEQALGKKDIAGFKSAGIQYRDLLRAHIDKENNVLFMMADRLLDEAKQEALFEHFEHHEEAVIGHGVHEELHAKIHAWEVEFLSI